jgi:hypothetical protein
VRLVFHVNLFQSLDVLRNKRDRDDDEVLDASRAHLLNLLVGVRSQPLHWTHSALERELTGDRIQLCRGSGDRGRRGERLLAYGEGEVEEEGSSPGSWMAALLVC